MNRTYHKVLTIAGSDSGGGAGIQADLKTYAALGCYGMSVITALTAQNTKGVSGIYPIPPSFVVEQLDAVFTDIETDAIKIGMLYSAELIEAVANQLKKYGAKKIVLDPVMVAQSGDKLLKDDAIEAIKTYLMPLAHVVTPNLPEAEVMLGQSIKKMEEMQDASRSLAKYGSQNILIKGGHLIDQESTDLLYMCNEDRSITLKEDRIETQNNHGTGCTLSSAIAAYLARGNKIEEAVINAKHYITGAIKAGTEYEIGKGHGPVHHFFQNWR